MNEQQWDHFLNEKLRTEDNEIPQIISQRINVTLASLEDKRVMKRSVSVAKIIASVACILLVFTFSFAYFSPAAAERLSKIPVVGSAFEWVGDPGLKSSIQNRLIESTRLSAMDKDITITLDQIIYDGTRLSIGLIHEETVSAITSSHLSFKADGIEVNASISGVNKEIPEGLKATVYHFTPVDPLPDEFEMTLTFDEVQISQGSHSKTVKGQWQFKTTVSKITEGITVRTFNPPLSKSFEGTTISITQLTLTPVTVKIEFDLIESEKYTRSNPQRQGLPELFESNRLSYELMNEQGLYLEKLSAGGGGKAGEPKKYSALFAPLTMESNTLTFQVIEESIKMRKAENDTYIGDEEIKLSSVELPHELPLTIQQGEAGEITFYNIQFDPEQTWVEFEVWGKDPQRQISAWWIENDKGERFLFDRYDQTHTSDDRYAYRTKLAPIDPDEKLKVVVVQLKSPHVIKELELTISVEE